MRSSRIFNAGSCAAQAARETGADRAGDALRGDAGDAAADELYREELRIPMAAAGPRGLEAVLIRPAGTRRYPLALISHGTPRDESERAQDDAQSLLYAGGRVRASRFRSAGGDAPRLWQFRRRLCRKQRALRPPRLPYCRPRLRQRSARRDRCHAKSPRRHDAANDRGRTFRRRFRQRRIVSRSAAGPRGRHQFRGRPRLARR